MARHFIFLYLLGTSISFLATADAHEAIVNGIKAQVDQFPYQVALQFSNNEEFCGGGIIHEQFILTAAHCFIKDGIQFKDGPFYVLAGTNDLNKRDRPAVTVEVEKIFLPSEYKRTRTTVDGDIAVARLKHPLELSRHINKLELPKHKHETFYNKTAVIAGFGWQWIKIIKDLQIGGRNDSQLRFSETDVRKSITALGLVKLKVPEDYIYAKVKQPDHSKPSGLCRGDSGSPLVYNNMAIGISVSGPPKCSELKRGGLYSNVAHHLELIKNALKDKPHKGIRTYIVP